MNHTDRLLKAVNTIILSDDDFDRFVDAINDPPKPNASLFDTETKWDNLKRKAESNTNTKPNDK